MKTPAEWETHRIDSLLNASRMFKGTSGMAATEAGKVSADILRDAMAEAYERAREDAAKRMTPLLDMARADGIEAEDDEQSWNQAEGRAGAYVVARASIRALANPYTRSNGSPDEPQR